MHNYSWCSGGARVLPLDVVEVSAKVAISSTLETPEVTPPFDGTFNDNSTGEAARRASVRR